MPPFPDASLTRRRFLAAVGWFGGADAAAAALQALGLAAPVNAYAGSPRLAAGPNGQTRVLVLGAGLAGLVAAYELTRAGYHCTVLEALAHPGGRARSLRRGDLIERMHGTTQTCDFDDACTSMPVRHASLRPTAACWITAAAWLSRSKPPSRATTAR